jgi:hypothetical protein
MHSRLSLGSLAVSLSLLAACSTTAAEPPADASGWGTKLPDEGQPTRNTRSYADESLYVAGPIVRGKELARHPSSPHPKACASYYPKGVHEGAAKVRLWVLVEPTGVASGASVIDEAPEGQGFAIAALRCVSKLKYEPGADAAGKPVRAFMSATIAFEDAE